MRGTLPMDSSHPKHSEDPRPSQSKFGGRTDAAPTRSIEEFCREAMITVV